jgi:DNA-binding transcriptional ArsR family regulator
MDTQVLSALAEPSRLNIVELLKTQPRTVNQVAALLDIKQPQASKHLHRLFSAGLVVSYPKAQQRIYALRPEPFLELEQWLKSFKQLMNDRLDSLEVYLEQNKKG